MGAALCFDDFPQCSHHLIMGCKWALIVKRRLNFRAKPAIVRFGLCDSGEL